MGFNSSTFGFQGQEMDNEVKGTGNMINYKYRVHDVRIGRFLSIDPLTKKYPMLTPYQFSSNNPIGMVEIEGLEGCEIRFRMIEAARNAPKLEIAFDEYMEKSDPSRQMAKTFFQLPFYNNETAINLIEHYTNGWGVPYKLSEKEMLAVYPTYTGDAFGNLIDIDLSLTPQEFMSVGALKPGESKEFEKEVKEVYARQNGTLGYFNVIVKGKISINESNTREFNGTVSLTDTYDFNASDHRNASAEAQVTVARNFLPGNPFEVSGSINVTQWKGMRIFIVTAENKLLNPQKLESVRDTDIRNEMGRDAQDATDILR